MRREDKTHVGQCGERSYLKCLYANLQSLINKRNEIKLRLDQESFDMMFFTEIWINENIDESELFIPGFQTPFIHPKASGGAAVYIRDGIVVSKVSPPAKMNYLCG